MFPCPNAGQRSLGWRCPTCPLLGDVPTVACVQAMSSPCSEEPCPRPVWDVGEGVEEPQVTASPRVHPKGPAVPTRTFSASELGCQNKDTSSGSAAHHTPKSLSFIHTEDLPLPNENTKELFTCQPFLCDKIISKAGASCIKMNYSNAVKFTKGNLLLSCSNLCAFPCFLFILGDTELV